MSISSPSSASPLPEDATAVFALRMASLSPARAWTLVACLAFLFATAYAVAVVVFRLPLPGLQAPHLFRVALALHVELAVYFWLMATAAATWAAARHGGGRHAPVAAVAAGIGTLLLAAAPLAGGTPLMADYFPWLAGNAIFVTGFALFTGAVACAAAAATQRTLLRRETPRWRGAGIAAVPVLAAVATLLADLAAGASGIADLAWGAGHVLLFSHVALMCWEWGQLAGTGRTDAGRIQRRAATVLAAVSLALPLIPFVFPPGTVEHQHAFTFAMTWLLWPPAAVAALATLASLRRKRGGADLAQRLALVLSIVLFVVGNLLGALIGEPTTLVTAHYHAAIGAVALSRMAMSYDAAASLALAVPSAAAARRQIATYATALVLLFSGLAVGALDAAPRKTSAGELAARGPYFKLGMSIAGVGGLFAIAGSLWLVINLTRSTGGRRTFARNAPPD